MGGRILELESERLHRIGMQQGIQQGIQQGMQQGVEEGMQKGVEKGTINAIVRMIKKDYPKAQILDLGYTEEEYQKAEKQLLIKA